MALFVRKFTFATRFCDVLIVYFRLFLNSKPYFHVSLHFVCTFRRCFFLPLAILALHPLFCSTIRNKKTAQTVLPNPSVLFLRTV